MGSKYVDHSVEKGPEGNVGEHAIDDAIPHHHLEACKVLVHIAPYEREQPSLGKRVEGEITMSDTIDKADEIRHKIDLKGSKYREQQRDDAIKQESRNATKTQNARNGTSEDRSCNTTGGN